MSNVIDYFEKLRTSNEASEFWIRYEVEQANGDVQAARLAVWQSLLEAKRVKVYFFNEASYAHG